MLQRTLEREVGGLALRHEAILHEGQGWGGLHQPHQLVQLAVRMEAPVLIACWPAEVLSNGLAECCSHCRGGLQLPGSRPSAPEMPPLPGQPGRAQLCTAPLCCPRPLPRTEKRWLWAHLATTQVGKGRGHQRPRSWEFVCSHGTKPLFSQVG